MDELRYLTGLHGEPGHFYSYNLELRNYVTDNANCLLIDGELHAIYYCSTDSFPCQGAFRIRKAHVCSLNDFFSVLSSLLGRTFEDDSPWNYTWSSPNPKPTVTRMLASDATLDAKGGWMTPGNEIVSSGYSRQKIGESTDKV